MKKLIYLQRRMSDMGGEWFFPIPFEYSSKDDFILYVLELIEKAEKNKRKTHFNEYISLFGFDIEVSHLYSIENLVFTLEEWFENEKEKI